MNIRVNAKLIIILSAAALIVLTICMLTVGTAQVPLTAITAVLIKSLFGINASFHFTAAEKIIIWDIRWQRIAIALIVGSGLAVSGACFQTIFKNPLADPFVLGISSGAALGAAVAVVTNHSNWIILFAFCGAVFCMVFVYLFSQKNAYIRSDQQLLLAGVACGALLNALLFAVMALHSQQLEIIVFWLMGSLTNYLESLSLVFAIIAGGITLIFVFARDLDILVLGDEQASYLGVNVERVKLLLLVVTTLITGVCVAVSGIIGFVGLVVPHMVRKIIGGQHRLLIPLSAIWGAFLLLTADGLIRTVPFLVNIPVGVVTALFGSPFFLYLLRGRRG